MSPERRRVCRARIAEIKSFKSMLYGQPLLVDPDEMLALLNMVDESEAREIGRQMMDTHASAFRALADRAEPHMPADGILLRPEPDTEGGT